MDKTLITAFYDLNRYENRLNWRSKNNYLKWGQFILELNMNIVFYVEKDMYHYIWQKRKEYNLLNKTYIVTKDLHKLKYYDIKNKIYNFIYDDNNDHKMINLVDGKHTENYMIILWNKFNMVEDIMKLNPFNTQIFGWIDFGVYHVLGDNIPNNIDDMFNINIDKIKIMLLRPTFKHEITNISSFAKENKYKVAAGLWIGNMEYMIKFIDLFYKKLNYLLSLNIAIMEEMIIPIIYVENKEIFDPYYGNYAQILINFKKITVYDDLIINYISMTRKNNDSKTAYEIALKIYNDCYDNLEIHQKYNILDELIINGFYVDKDNSLTFCVKMLDELNNDKFFEIFKINNNIDRQIINISYYDPNIIVGYAKKYIDSINDNHMGPSYNKSLHIAYHFKNNNLLNDKNMLYNNLDNNNKIIIDDIISKFTTL